MDSLILANESLIGSIVKTAKTKMLRGDKIAVSYYGNGDYKEVIAVIPRDSNLTDREINF